MSRKQHMILAGLTLAVVLVLGCLFLLLSQFLPRSHLNLPAILPLNPSVPSIIALAIASGSAVGIPLCALAITYWRRRNRSRPRSGAAAEPRSPDHQAAPAPPHLLPRVPRPSGVIRTKTDVHGARKTASHPRLLHEFIGQPKITEILGVTIRAARARGDALGHVLLRGPTGCGKRTLARVIANEMRVKTTSTSGGQITAAGDLAAIITNLGDRDILCIADIQRLPKPIEERLCRAMQNFAVDIVIGKGPSAKTVHLPLPRFTVVGTSTQPERVSHQLRQSFEHVLDFEPYEVWALVKLVQRLAGDIGVHIDENARLTIARACGGSLIEARRLLLRTRDYAQARADGVITAGIAQDALAVIGTQHPSAAPEPTPTIPETPELRGNGFTWQDFEDFVADLFTSLGYQNVRVTPRAGDEGKDIIMERADPLKGTTRVYVECKHWSSGRVGIKEVQVLHSAVMRDPQVHEGMLVTTGRFTNQAMAYAQQIGFIELIDHKKLRELALKAGLELDPRIRNLWPTSSA